MCSSDCFGDIIQPLLVRHLGRTYQLLVLYQLGRESAKVLYTDPQLFIPFSLSIVSLKSQGARWPRGSIETIFFLSAHWEKGPMFAAGSVLVKSGLI